MEIPDANVYGCTVQRLEKNDLEVKTENKAGQDDRIILCTDQPRVVSGFS